MKVIQVNGAEIPAIGFGTWPMRGATCRDAVAEALRVGYRHIDTAQGYGNEADVADGIGAAGVPRGEIFVTTKVKPELLRHGDLQRSAEESLGRLKLDVIDLLLAHWPNPDVPVEEVVGGLLDAKRRGLARHIGVSNFTVADLDRAIAVAGNELVTEQLEYHPYVTQTKILAAIRRHCLAVTAYCPVALGRVVDDPVLVDIGRRHGKTAAQVTLRWLIQQGDVIAIPKSSHPARIRENFDVYDFALTPEEMAAVNALQRGERIIFDRALVAEWDD